MNAPVWKPRSGRWWRWPLICLLAGPYLIAAMLGMILSILALAANLAARWLLDRIDDLKD